MGHLVVSRWTPRFLVLIAVCVVGCEDSKTDSLSLTAETPLHLEEHMDAARVEGSETPLDIPESVEWRFDEPQPGWLAAKPVDTRFKAVEPVPVEDAWRLPLTGENGADGNRLVGAIYVEVPGWSLQDWGYVEVRARSHDPVRYVGLAFNHLIEGERMPPLPFQTPSDRAFVISDGTIQTYRLAVESPYMTNFEGPWTHLAIWFNSDPNEESVALDILSVRAIPREAEYATHRFGVKSEGRRTLKESGQLVPDRLSIFSHVPSRISYRLTVPDGGRLDVGLGVLRHGSPVSFAVSTTTDEGFTRIWFEETYGDPKHWSQQVVDLSEFAGQTIRLNLETRGENEVAFWATPTISGSRKTGMPNVILYVIDGAGADHMSVYGYNRRTTPNLERIAAEGAIFLNAYSNSSWTRPSTASFMSSLQHSAMGGFRNGFNLVPSEVKTLSEHLHGAGFQTAEITSNPNAGRMSNLNRGVDFFRDAGVDSDSTSSVELHENYWQWREAYPGEPYFVRFQPTDVHWPHEPVAPFSGLFIDLERRQLAEAWDERLESAGEWLAAFEETGVDRMTYAAAFRDLYDEDMAHVDHQIGKLVARLKKRGEWKRTLLIVASDHGPAAGSQDWQLLMREDVPSAFDFSHRGTPMFRSGVSRIPLIVVWPGRIEPGQVLSQPVSMIDVLPTILDLASLPMPEIMQGQSLAPLLLGTEGWQPRPVILDEFNTNPETGELGGRIEIIDGRWGASLEINADTVRSHWGEQPPDTRRLTPLLLHDVIEDPMAIRPMNEHLPDLVPEYTDLLERQLDAHILLSQQFSRQQESPLTSEQLETLQSLGYIQ